jgi:hypothetical protein
MTSVFKAAAAPIGVLMMFMTFLFQMGAAHAQAACPPGTIPYGGGQGLSTCGADNSQQQSGDLGATPPLWLDRWMAFATDAKHSILGLALDRSNVGEAQRAALSDCRAKGGVDCKFENAFLDSCAAVTVGDHGYTIMGEVTLAEATKQSRDVCKKEGDASCYTYYAACDFAVRLN